MPGGRKVYTETKNLTGPQDRADKRSALLNGSKRLVVIRPERQLTSQNRTGSWRNQSFMFREGGRADCRPTHIHGNRTTNTPNPLVSRPSLTTKQSCFHPCRHAGAARL